MINEVSVEDLERNKKNRTLNTAPAIENSYASGEKKIDVLVTF